MRRNTYTPPRPLGFWTMSPPSLSPPDLLLVSLLWLLRPPAQQATASTSRALRLAPGAGGGAGSGRWKLQVARSHSPPEALGRQKSDQDSWKFPPAFFSRGWCVGACSCCFITQHEADTSPSHPQLYAQASGNRLNSGPRPKQSCVERRLEGLNSGQNRCMDLTPGTGPAP